MSNLKLSDFKSLPIVIQVIIVSFSWIFLFFVTDAWFSPFVIHGYLLISYSFTVVLLASSVAHSSLIKLIKSDVVLNWTGTVNEPHNQKKHRTVRKLSLKDVTEKELGILVRNATEAIVSQWGDESSENEDFVKEIHNQVDDIFQALSQKLSKIKLEKFVRSSILLVHHHLKKYIQTIGSHNKFPFSHPVSKGEISLECYLDGLSHAIMKEFMPGSIQDCSAIFDLLSTAFCCQVLVEFVKNLSEPELVLLSILQLLESTSLAHSCEEEDVPDFSVKLIDLPTVIEAIEEPLLGSSPHIRATEEFVVTDVVEKTSNYDLISTNSPVLAGNLISQTVTVKPSEQPSFIQTGLCCTLSAATAPLLQSQVHEEIPPSSSETKCKPPDSLLIGNGSSTDSAPPSAGEPDISPVYEVSNKFIKSNFQV